MTALIIASITIAILFALIAALQSVQAVRMAQTFAAAEAHTTVLVASTDAMIARTYEMVGA